MLAASPHAIGRTLARLGRAARIQDLPEGRVPTSRDAVYDAVARSAGPVTVEDVCRSTGLHANTVRAHLDVLHAAGRIAREQHAPRGRGRPPLLFTVVPDYLSPREELAATLLGQLADVAVPGLLDAAAERWAASIAEPAVPAETPDEAVQEAATALAEVGFDARVDAVGDRIELRGCPYARLVAERPVICDTHAALIVRLLADSGQPVTLEHLDVWTRPSLCVAHLARPDITPDRVVRPGPPAGHAAAPVAGQTPEPSTAATTPRRSRT